MKGCPKDWTLVNNRTCIGFSGEQTNLTEAKRRCTSAVTGGRLIDGSRLTNVTELLVSATEFLKSQNKTNGDWFLNDASYDNRTKREKWSNSSGKY